ncbi:LysR family transcriptional regulator [Geodermatophilus marinus]|uniref:LysR substrate-binding domain-containing protein n=1 Tax=Geodermatophilus sp. LHW52908 TaxID=2303986 RepID=UPI0013143EA0|nr:LysR family transcriptional regulator [Geodermatophilus sp. LHW52908]
MDVDLRLVRYVVAIADAGTYGRAAAALHVATPSLSQQIRRFEQQLGCVLFERDHRGARLTAAGEEFLPLARELLAVQDRALAVTRRHRRARRAVLRVGFLTGVAGPLTRPILDRLAERAPGTSVELVALGWGDQVAAVVSGRVDAAFARPPLPAADGVLVEPVLAEPRVAVVRAGHPLAGRASLRIADLAGVVQPWTDAAPPEWVRWWSVDPGPDGSRARFGPTVHGIEEMLEAVAVSDVVAITAESVRHVYPRADLVFTPIVDVEPTAVALVVPHPHRNPLVDCLLGAVRELRAPPGAGTAISPPPRPCA